MVATGPEAGHPPVSGVHDPHDAIRADDHGLGPRRQLPGAFTRRAERTQVLAISAEHPHLLSLPVEDVDVPERIHVQVDDPAELELGCALHATDANLFLEAPLFARTPHPFRRIVDELDARAVGHGAGPPEAGVVTTTPGHREGGDGHAPERAHPTGFRTSCRPPHRGFSCRLDCNPTLTSPRAPSGPRPSSHRAPRPGSGARYGS